MFLPLVAAAATLAVIVVVVATTTFACSFSSLLLNGNIGHNTHKYTLTHTITIGGELDTKLAHTHTDEQRTN